ncbi:hypothetical protein Ddc_11618 [Ditylenchus destructor]|nr:hypothetical protein Ddc_11618 [Ditylenchus destructor]
MLPTYILVDILRCTPRNALDIIKETTHALNNIVKSEFASKPLHLLGMDYLLTIHINNGFLLMAFHRIGDCFVPKNREWQKCGKYRCEHCYPFDEMRPFLTEYIRFGNTKIVIRRDDESCMTGQIAALESIAHIWTGQTLSIVDCCFSSILSNSTVLQCRNLKLDGQIYADAALNVFQYPALYKLETIYFCWGMEAVLMGGIIQKKTADHPQSETTLVFTLSDINDLSNVVGKVREETTQVINEIIKRDFASKPLLLLDETIVPKIRNDYLQLCRPHLFFNPTLSEWQYCDHDEECEHSYPLDEMRPFLANYIRFRKVRIHIDDLDLPFYTPEQVTLLESISHIWSGQVLTIMDHWDYNNESIKRIFENSNIVQCRSLMYWKNSGVLSRNAPLMDIHRCSHLYTLHAIYITWIRMESNILNLTHFKTAYPQSDTIFVISKGHSRFHSFESDDFISMHDAFETIKKEFATSSTSCRLRVIIEIMFSSSIFSLPENFEFRLENNRTKEVLQLKRITKQEAKEQFDVALYEYTNIYNNFPTGSFIDGTSGQAVILERYIA